MYAVYVMDTGELHAVERTIDAGLPAGMEALEVDDATGIWDSATRTFAPVPPKRVIDRTAFIERFTMAEWVGLVALKPSDSIMAAVFERLALLDQVDLDSAFVQAAAAHCVQQGHLSQERMAEVLA